MRSASVNVAGVSTDDLGFDGGHVDVDFGHRHPEHPRHRDADVALDEPAQLQDVDVAGDHDRDVGVEQLAVDAHPNPAAFDCFAAPFAAGAVPGAWQDAFHS